MKVSETTLPGVLLIEPRVFTDSRGVFMETWRQDRYAAQGSTAFCADYIFNIHTVKGS
jgi:dTDP-4-dehydrorhamnose 3,5-epimerase